MPIAMFGLFEGKKKQAYKDNDRIDAIAKKVAAIPNATADLQNSELFTPSEKEIIGIQGEKLVADLKQESWEIRNADRKAK